MYPSSGWCSSAGSTYMVVLCFQSRIWQMWLEPVQAATISRIWHCTTEASHHLTMVVGYSTDTADSLQRHTTLVPPGQREALSDILGGTAAAAALLLLALSCPLQPFEFLGTCASSGVMCMALAWVLLDFTDNPPGGSNFSSPRK